MHHENAPDKCIVLKNRVEYKNEKTIDEIEKIKEDKEGETITTDNNDMEAVGKTNRDETKYIEIFFCIFFFICSHFSSSLFKIEFSRSFHGNRDLWKIMSLFSSVQE